MLNKLVFLAGLLSLAACGEAANATTARVADAFAILTNPSGVSPAWRMIKFIEDALTSSTIAFDVVVFDKAATPRLNLTNAFWHANGTGKYRGYFMYPNLEAIGDLTKDEVTTLWDYQVKTGVRSAKFGAWVATLGFNPAYDASGSQDLGMSLTAAAPLGTSGIPLDAALSANGLWRTPGKLAEPMTYCAIWANDFAGTGIIPPCTPTPILTLAAAPALGPAWANPGVTGVLVKYGDGRETMGFVHDCADWSATCGTLTKLATDWMASGPAGVDTAPPPPPPPPRTVVIDHRVLILTVPGFTSTDFIVQTLTAYGIPHDVVRFDQDATPRLDLQALFWNPDGTGRYSSFVMYPNLEATGQLRQAEVNLIWDYQKKTGARSVKFGVWPSNVGWDPNYAACSAAAGTMGFTAATPLGISGIRATAQLSTSGLYRCPGIKATPQTSCGIWAADFSTTGLVPACTPTSILETPDGVVGTLVKYGDGRESMAFVFDCAGWSTSCVLLSHLAVTWMTQGVIAGERRALLSVQMDDVFLGTEADNKTYRCSVADWNAQVKYQEQTVAGWPNTPPGTDIKLEMPWNGNGILEMAENKGLTTSLEVFSEGCFDFPEYFTLGCSCWSVGAANCPASAPQFCRQCIKDWAKPAGYGANRVPASTPTGWTKTVLNADPRAAAIIQDTTGSGITSKFFWSHHTFNHMNLDNATTYDAEKQIGLNVLMAAAAHLNLASKPTSSNKCMVTPQISGLMNGDALRALRAAGLECATGDNTWEHLKNQQHPYQMLYSNAARNGYDGFAFLPRFATEIYYNCTNAAQIERLYNNLYQPYYGSYSTIADIIKREAVRVVREGLLALKHDPYMMHQANLAVDSTGQSLAMRWITGVLNEFHALVNWPVQSKKLDDLYAIFKEREARDACKLSYKIEIAPNKQVQAVTITSGGGACDAPLTVPATTTASAGAAQRIGNDAPAYKIPLAAGGSARVTLSGGPTWSLP